MDDSRFIDEVGPPLFLHARSYRQHPMAWTNLHAAGCSGSRRCNATALRYSLRRLDLLLDGGGSCTRVPKIPTVGRREMVITSS